MGAGARVGIPLGVPRGGWGDAATGRRLVAMADGAAPRVADVGNCDGGSPVRGTDEAIGIGRGDDVFGWTHAASVITMLIESAVDTYFLTRRNTPILVSMLLEPVLVHGRNTSRQRDHLCTSHGQPCRSRCTSQRCISHVEDAAISRMAYFLVPACSGHLLALLQRVRH